MTDIPLAEIEALEARARAAGDYYRWSFAEREGEIDTFCGLRAVAMSPKLGLENFRIDAAFITACDPTIALALCAMARAKIAADDRVRELESELDLIDKQVKVTAEYDRQETSAKQRTPPGITTVEIGLSHVTDATKRMRRLLSSLSTEKERVDGN